MRRLGTLAGTFAVVALACPAAASAAPTPIEEAAMQTAKGVFTPTLTPTTSPAPAIGAMTIAKVFTGDLDATSSGLMLSAGSPQQGAAGYVAMETVSGTLAGRAGGFALQQHGTMDAGSRAMVVEVVPGSGTGALAGIAGTMDVIIAADGTHSYVLHYRLPR